MNATFNIIGVTTVDIPRISRFLALNSNNRNETDWANILQWMWVYNPSVHTETKLGWAIEDESGMIYGFIGNIPVQYNISGKIAPGIWGTSWYVDEKVRDLSLKMYIHFTRQTEMIFSNTQTQRVEIVMKKLGFVELPVEWFAGAYVFPLTIFSTSFLRSSFTGFSIKKLAVLFFGVMVKILRVLIFPLFNRSGFAKDISLERIHSFPDETDNWFEEFAKELDCTFLRDRKNYEWLFSHPVSASKFIKYKVVYENKIQGFLVFIKRSIKGFQYIEIIDEALLPLSDNTKTAIIEKVMITLYKEEADQHFLVFRSNLGGSSKFFRSLCGVNLKSIEKGYIKSSFVKPDIRRSTITSIDGDNLFF